MTQPQAAYVIFTNVLRHRWSFLARTMPGVHEYFHPLERTIATKLIPALTGRSPLGAEERSILAMPCRHGGLGIVSPPLLTAQFGASVKITEALVMKIRRQDMSLEGVSEQTRIAKSAVREAHRQQEEQHRKDVFNSVSPDLQRCMELAAEKGASNWLTCRPLARFGFALSKAEFRDALCLRYGWQPNNLPTKCVCGQQFTVTHALSCPNGGFPSIRHNEIRDVFAECLVKVAHAVEIEPHLEPLSGEHLQPRTAVRGDQARLDVVANGVYGGRFERSFLDVRVFNPYARSNSSSSIASVYRKHEQEKRRLYEARVREVEHASFIPVVYATSGGAGRSANALVKRIASLMAEKKLQPFSQVMAWLRSKISISLVRASILCLRGSRRPRARIHLNPDNIGLEVVEARLSS